MFFIVYIILLESHYAFDGNSGALFDYMRSHRKYRGYTYVWIVLGFKDGSYHNSRRVLAYSFSNNDQKKKWLINHARFSFYDDVPIQAKGKDAKTVYLRHGCPGIKNVKGIINTPIYVDYALCTSKSLIQRESERINCPIDKFFVSGMPRNDYLFKPKVDIIRFFNLENYNKTVLWLPTFRKVRNSDRCDSSFDYPFGIPLFVSNDDFTFLDTVLKRINMVLVIKAHPVQDLNVIHIPCSNNIIFLSHQKLLELRLDTYSLLSYSHALITDYSSVAFDYMLLNRPIAFTQDDIKEYSLGLVSDYKDLTPGYRIDSKDDLISFLYDVYSNNDSYKAKRSVINKYIHDYRDGNNSERVINYFGI